MRSKKGFTLIELLAVIVILAIIAAITVPIIVGIIDRVRVSSYKESVRSIFEAANIYVASQEFQKFPDEGINVTDSVIRIKNNDFTSGKIILNENGKLELDKVSNGEYCAGGTNEDLVVIVGSCDQLDVTPPTVVLNSNLVTSNSVTTVAVGEDLESGINGYQFSKDNGTTWTNKQTSNVYTFNNLTNNTDYTFRVRAINNNQLSTISNSITVTTNDILIPTYSINTTAWVSSAVVTITYPAREAGFVYQYSLDNALTWLTVDAPAITKDITFIDNGSVIARILDGTNEISGTSYTVANIDTGNPTLAINVVGSPFNAGGWAKVNFNVNISTSDDNSGIKNYIYCQTTSTSCTPTTVVNSTSGTLTISTESTTNKVCAQAFDYANNSSLVICSSNYKLDKTAPVITVNPTSLAVDIGSVYTDTGVTASDNLEGDITANIIKTGTVNTASAGTYTLNYNVSDSAGNAATTKTRTVSVTQIATSFSYTGSAKTFTASIAGKYKLEVWGAEGGGTLAGKGGYSSGEVTLTAGEILYINVGAKGSTGIYNQSPVYGGWNGGGIGYNLGGSGGGATDIRRGATALANRIIVAGAGGGEGANGITGGNAGGSTGEKGQDGYNPSTPHSCPGGNGGTQTAGGTTTGSYSGTYGSLGTGGDGGFSSGTYGGGGGGAGYYGGGGGGGHSSSTTGGGGGGSGYIGGVTNGQILAGSQSFSAPGGGTETGHTGNGYAKITFISS
ncbi:MAG: glycine-rich protein [Ignavibacteriales bacterium]